MSFFETKAEVFGSDQLKNFSLELIFDIKHLCLPTFIPFFGSALRKFIERVERCLVLSLTFNFRNAFQTDK